MTDWLRREFLQQMGAAGLAGPSLSPTARVGLSLQTEQAARSLPDRLGVTHVDGNYAHTQEDYLNEGAKRIRELGSRVIKLWFHHVSSEGETKYPYHSDWPTEFDSMVDIATHPYFEEVFQRDFRTYVLVAYSMNDQGGFSRGKNGMHYFVHGADDAQLQAEEDSFYNLTVHLLETYNGTGKEFVLQHWQGDWAILPFDTRSEIAANTIRADDPEPTPTAIEGMTKWLNARQRGIERAREAIESDVTVLHAAEVNMVLRAMRGQKRVINEVIPNTDVDLVAHNSYREMGLAADRWNPNTLRERFTEILDYVNEHTPAPTEYVKDTLVDPDRNVFIGEYGLPFEVVGTETATRVSKAATNISLEWGATWTLFWQLYGNEHGKGFWLIRPGGKTTLLYDYFEQVLATNSLPELPRYTELVLEFNQAVPEHEVNSEVSKEDSRWLTFACSQLELLDAADNTVAAYDIGTDGAEPILTKGVSWAGSHEGRTWRWFVGQDATHARTHVYVPRSVARQASTLLITGRPIAEADITADVVVNGDRTDTVDFPVGAGWNAYRARLQTRTPTPTPTPTQTPTATAPPQTAAATTTDSPTRSQSPATTADGSGFSAVGSAIGLGSLLVLLRKWSRDGD